MNKLLLSALVLAAAFAAIAAEAPKGASPDLAALKRMAARLAPTDMKVDTSALSSGDRQALVVLVRAGRVVNDIFLSQLWSGNPNLYAKLKRDTSTLGRDRLHYFWINKSPWSEIDGHTAFLPGVPARKLPGANFYPEDMTKEEFETWVKALPKERREQAEGFYTVIRRDGKGRLAAVPYSEAYRANLDKAARLLREAASATDNASLKKFLELRADAFLSNDYYASDIAWMDLDAPLDVTIGPYETYNDEIFGYKAAFEAYVNVRDDKETEKLAFFGSHLQDIENNLPEDPQYRNPKLGALSPIRVVNEVFGAGDGSHGIQTAAYNLPNDDRVVAQKGSKRVMLKNVQEAKFHTVLEPIAKKLLPAAMQPDVDFNSFFTWILAHELTHGIGPHEIKVGGRDTNPRFELKELYSTIEEAKADVTGLFALQFLMDQKAIPGGEEAERKLYTTYLASAFRTLHFGLQDSHARGQAMQMNYLLDQGAVVAGADGTFSVDFSKIKEGIRGLDNMLLTLEATGDYDGTKKKLAELAVLRPPVAKALDSLGDIPTDIEPVFTTANLVAPERRLPGAPRKKVTEKK
jgi:hypothetical protein